MASADTVFVDAGVFIFTRYCTLRSEPKRVAKSDGGGDRRRRALAPFLVERDNGSSGRGGTTEGARFAPSVVTGDT